MSRRRLLVYVGIVFTAGLAVLGFVLFTVSLVVEFINTRQIDVLDEGLSPVVSLALAGLCLSALMFALWFGLVGLLIARQTRRMGSGYSDAYHLIEAFRFREAIPLLEQSIEQGKESADILMLLTSAYAYSGQFAKAQATADRAVSLYPEASGSYVTLANGYRLQAAYDEAAAALGAAIRREPDQPILWAEMGFMQLLGGQYEDAIASLEQAAQHAMPAMYVVRVYYHLAEAYERSGEASRVERARSRMIGAREGLAVWKAGLRALEGTAYGQVLRYEIECIEQAIAEIDRARSE